MIYTTHESLTVQYMGEAKEKGYIYFDMDGVMADFARGVKELLHLEPLDQEHSTSETDEVLFAAMREYPHFYDALEPIPGSIEIFDEVYEIYGDRCMILSGIPKPRRGIVTAAEDKNSWVKRYLPEGVIVHTVSRAEKKNFVHDRNDILIDDFTKNIAEWESAGGTGIHCRTPEELRGRLVELGILQSR